MTQTKTETMTEGNSLRLILTFALPLLLGNLLQQTYNMADAAIVGRYLGTDALASVGASSSVQFLVMGFCIGICLGFAIPVAQRFGAVTIRQCGNLFSGCSTCRRNCRILHHSVYNPVSEYSAPFIHSG